MNSSSVSGWFDRSRPALSVEETVALEKVCNAFEAAWRAGARADIGTAVAGLAEPLRTAALRELIELDAYYRNQVGETPSRSDYTESFPGLATAGQSDEEVLKSVAATTTLPAGTRVGYSGGYELLGEVARGGMGVVYRAQDAAIGRDVAVKVLHDRLRDNPVAARRFVEEARIAGQLQHPGIPPVFEIGEMADGSPFLAMKLIKGRTLADLLTADAPPDRSLLLGTFEQLCQALAYAHDRGVVHRDLKPANVMVGAFSEVQVMDWGLAKVLGGEDLPAADMVPDATTIRDPRGGDPGSATRAGSILGTPAYMSPEQAAGAVGEIDRRADVFGLGAILCAVLTGKPPYLADTAEATRLMAARGQQTGALERLDRCGAEPELVSLCKRCLAADRADRPADAGAVASAVAGLRAAADERARRAEVERAAADARAAEQRKRRRVQATLGLAFTALVVLGGAFAWWAREQRLAQKAQQLAQQTKAERIVHEAVEVAVAKYGRARGANWDVALWAEARAAALHAETQAANAPDEVRDRVRALTAEIEQVEKNRRLIATLLDIHASMGDTLLPNGDQDFPGANARYNRAFLDYGTDLMAMPTAKAAELLLNLGAEVRVELAAALDDWGYVRYVLTRQMNDAAPMFQVTRLLDPDPMRNQIRDAAAAKDVAALRTIADTIDPAVQPVQTVNLIAVYLYWFRSGDRWDAIRFLRKSQPHYPGDFQMNHNLAFFLIDERRFTDAIPYCMAAIAARPKSAAAWSDLVRAHRQSNQASEAAVALRRLHQLAPHHHNARLTNATLLDLQGKPEEAVAEFRALAVQLDTAAVTAHVCHDLAINLHKHGWYGDALQFLTRVLNDRPDLANDPISIVRYNGACLAILRAAGKGKDPAPPADRPALRRQALDWLNADLAAWQTSLKADSAGNRETVFFRLQNWLTDDDFETVRAPHKLAELPADERTNWQRLWADTRTLVGRVAPAEIPARPVSLPVGHFLPRDSAATRFPVFHPDGRHLLTPDGKDVVAWDLQNGQKVRTFTGSAGRVMVVRLTADAKSVIAYTIDKRVYGWDWSTGRKFAEFPVPECDQPITLAVFPDGKRVAVPGPTGSVSVREWPGGKELYRITLKTGVAWVAHLEVSPDGQWLAVVAPAGEVFLWDAVAQRPGVRFPATSQVNSHAVCAFSPDGRFLGIGTSTHLRIWVVGQWKQPHISIPVDASGRMAFDQAGECVIVAPIETREGEAAVTRWDAWTGAARGKLTFSLAQRWPECGIDPHSPKVAVDIAASRGFLVVDVPDPNSPK